MIHHRFGPFSLQREIFERITCATAVLDDLLSAFRDIDRCLQAARRDSKPVYLELPRGQTGRPSLINVELQANDTSPDMRRLAQHLGQKVNG